MICPNCNKETNGIKLNGKLFCGFCAEPIQTNNIVENTNIKTTKTNQITQQAPVGTIQKHHRQRVGHNSFEIYNNEPNPITTPEIESPGVINPKESPELPANVNNKTNPRAPEPQEPTFNLLSKDDRDALKTKKKSRQAVFSSFLKETSKSISAKTPNIAKSKTKHKSSRLGLVGKIVFFFLVIFLLFVGLVIYVNYFANNERKIKSNLERTADFDYQKPESVPYGYKLSYLSAKGDDFVEYYYTFSGNNNRYLIIRIEKTDLKQEDIQSSLITPLADTFQVSIKNKLSFWQVGDGKIFVISGGLLYTFSQSGEILPENFLHIATETLL